MLVGDAAQRSAAITLTAVEVGSQRWKVETIDHHLGESDSWGTLDEIIALVAQVELAAADSSSPVGHKQAQGRRRELLGLLPPKAAARVRETYGPDVLIVHPAAVARLAVRLFAVGPTGNQRVVKTRPVSRKRLLEFALSLDATSMEDLYRPVRSTRDARNNRFFEAYQTSRWFLKPPVRLRYDYSFAMLEELTSRNDAPLFQEAAKSFERKNDASIQSIFETSRTVGLNCTAPGLSWYPPRALAGVDPVNVKPWLKMYSANPVETAELAAVDIARSAWSLGSISRRPILYDPASGNERVVRPHFLSHLATAGRIFTELHDSLPSYKAENLSGEFGRASEAIVTGMLENASTVSGELRHIEKEIWEKRGRDQKACDLLMVDSKRSAVLIESVFRTASFIIKEDGEMLKQFRTDLRSAIYEKLVQIEATCKYLTEEEPSIGQFVPLIVVGPHTMHSAMIGDDLDTAWRENHELYKVKTSILGDRSRSTSIAIVDPVELQLLLKVSSMRECSLSEVVTEWRDGIEFAEIATAQTWVHANHPEALFTSA